MLMRKAKWGVIRLVYRKRKLNIVLINEEPIFEQ